MRVGTAAWNSAATEARQYPVYYAEIDGLSTRYATGPIEGAGFTVEQTLEVPQSFSQTIDLLDGSATVQSVRLVIADVDDGITELVATEGASAPLSTLINRKVSVFGGYRGLDVADYKALTVGRLRGARLVDGLTAYSFDVDDQLILLDGEIMSNATDLSRTVIEGNVINVLWSVLSGTFDTGHATFPLDSITGTPTGLGLPSSLINETRLVSERDTWHSDSTVRFTFADPEGARSFIEEEIARVFSGFLFVDGDGKIGLSFIVPPLPGTTVQEVTQDDVIDVRSWQRVYVDHLNAFTVRGDHDLDAADDDFATLINDEQTADQAATLERVEYLVESRGLRTELNGTEIATELGARVKARYLTTPARIIVALSFDQLTAEGGDVVLLTHPEIPDLATGTRGVALKPMLVLRATPRFSAGLVELTLVDAGFYRYGLIIPTAAGIGDYDTATPAQQAKYCWIGRGVGNTVGTPAVDGYRWI